VPRALRSVHLERALPAIKRRLDQVRVPSGVVLVQMSEKGDGDFRRMERRNALSNAPCARRMTPAPKSTRYAVPLTTMAVAGPERAMSNPGVPVPSITT
jgi:hypothetical protein